LGITATYAAPLLGGFCFQLQYIRGGNAGTLSIGGSAAPTRYRPRH
jgi:hypothetical protein